MNRRVQVSAAAFLLLSAIVGASLDEDESGGPNPDIASEDEDEDEELYYKLMKIIGNKRFCMRSGERCDFHPHRCCSRYYCRCNFFGSNCSCQPKGRIFG